MEKCPVSLSCKKKPSSKNNHMFAWYFSHCKNWRPLQVMYSLVPHSDYTEDLMVLATALSYEVVAVIDRLQYVAVRHICVQGNTGRRPLNIDMYLERLCSYCGSPGRVLPSLAPSFTHKYDWTINLQLYTHRFFFNQHDGKLITRGKCTTDTLSLLDDSRTTFPRSVFKSFPNW